MTAFHTSERVRRPGAFCRALFRIFLGAALAVAFLHGLAAAQTTMASAQSPSGAKPTAKAASAAGDPIPLAVGNTWIYEGEVWWMPRGLRRIYREHVTWSMEVTDVLHRGPWTAAVLYGHPSDLVSYEHGRERGTYLLLVRARRAGAPQVFLLRGQRVWEAWRRLQDRKHGLKELVHSEELVLDLPLHPGKRFCPGDSPAAHTWAGDSPSPTPPPDCWTVGGETPADLRVVEGAEEIADPVRYNVSQRTPYDHVVWTFVPGLGFTSYAYGHSGYVSAVELELVDFYTPTAMADTVLETDRSTR